MHSINLNILEIGEPNFDIHTNDHIVEVIDKAKSLNYSFAGRLNKNQQLILSANDAYQAIIPILKENMVVTHGDLDQLNILWDKTEQPIFIDWESAKKMNPTREMIRMSLNWSGIGSEHFSLPLYSHMLHAYVNSGGPFNVHHAHAALNTLFGSMINWMLYNMEQYETNDNIKAKNTAKNEINWAVITMKRLKVMLPDLLNVSNKLGNE